MSKLLLKRAVGEAIALALIAWFAVGTIRYPIESTPTFCVECALIVIAFTAGLRLRSFDRHRASIACMAFVVALPMIMYVVTRSMSNAIATEMAAMTSFGCAGLVMSVGSLRLRSISLVVSGFLTLFTVFISDAPYALLIGIGWITLCLWHLIANHWERFSTCEVNSVQHTMKFRPLMVAGAVGLVVLGTWAVRGRLGEASPFGFGFMPTSGGSQWSDPGARHGIGSGDAAIAAQQQADSFGAVDSEFFLESTESTLFDMFSDSVGQPKKRNVWERRQGMLSLNVQEAHGRSSKSEQGGSSFSTDRAPPERHSHLDDVRSKAAIQWEGPTGIRLAMNRYDTFDGVDWTNQAELAVEKMLPVISGQERQQTWFFDPATSREFFDGAANEIAVGRTKVIGLKSQRIPLPMMTSGVHIKEVIRGDFFAIDQDGSFLMPDRVAVPALTIVHSASRKLMEDELLDRLQDNCSLATQERWRPTELKKLCQQWTNETGNKYQQLQSIVDHLRAEFELDSTVDLGEGELRLTDSQTEFPIETFLRTKRGGQHLFATTAALMAREIGLESRLVTGFYVRPSAFDLGASHSNVMPRDVHVWAEVKLDDQHWFEIEPSPGYLPPVYSPSLWLRSKRYVAENWPLMLGGVLSLYLMWRLRLIWLEWALMLVWWLSSWLPAQARLRLAVRIIETRAWLIGKSRPAGQPTRDWLLMMTGNDSTVEQGHQEILRSFCDLADRICFGNASSHHDIQASQRQVLRDLVRTFSAKRLALHFTEVTQ
ncbi:MAG: hypothetical protein CBB71_18035 [Rhodopirellula sp. TMED11]|nr:MAG: hypothetical protein CBB71_18035 [Rhodopirellula sp. TMED11]